VKYFIKLSKDGSFEPLGGVYEVDEKFHSEICKVIPRLIERGRVKRV
jgi:hypothetical protein